MPFKSEAQRRKFALLVKQGKMKQSVFDEWNNETGSTKLPERLKPKTGTIRSVEDIKRFRKGRFGV